MENIGVIFYNFSFEQIDQFFNWCVENNVEYVEIRKSAIEDKIDRVEKILAKTGIRISQVTAENDFIQKTKHDLLEHVKKIEIAGNIAKHLGCNQLRIDGGWPKQDIDEKYYRTMVLEGIERAVEVAEKNGFHLALDNHGVITNDYQFQIEIFEKIKSQYLGANLDTMNYRWFGYPVEQLIEIYKAIAPYVKHTHIKDGTGTRQNYTGKVLGEGEIPVIEAIRILKENNYCGVWCIEYEGKDKEIGYKKCIEFLKNLNI